MKVRSYFLFLILLAVGPLAFGGTIHRSLATPGDSLTVTRGDVTLEASGPSVSQGGTEEATVAVAPPDTVTVSWTSSGMHVSTQVSRQPGESDDGMTIRLARLVVALRKSFPPDPAPPAGG